MVLTAAVPVERLRVVDSLERRARPASASPRQLASNNLADPFLLAASHRVLEANANGVLLFSKWDPSEVEVKDISLTDYIQVRNPVLLPHTAGRYATKQFRKAQMPIVERLVNR